MCDGKCGRGSMLCPFSFGLAVGLTCFFAVMIWTLWVLQYGVPASMSANYVAPENLTAGFILSLWCLLKGFIGGFFIALFYDLFIKCKKCCCKKDGKVCGCGCGGVGCKCNTNTP